MRALPPRLVAADAVSASAHPPLRPPARLRTVGLGVAAGARSLVRAVSLDFPAGQLVGVVGPSGAGKSVLLAALAGRCRPAEGYLEMDGRPLDASPALASRIGYVPQGDVVFDMLTPAENFAFAAALRPGRPPRDAEAVLRQLGLEDRADVPVRRLSGGERKRVNVGVELLHDPPVLILDEPTAGLDRAAEEWLMRFLRGVADRGRLVILSTHATGNLAWCDRAVVVFGGRVVFDGNGEALRRFFAIDNVEDLYHILPQQTALEWQWEFGADPGAPPGASPSPDASPPLPGRAAGAAAPSPAARRSVFRGFFDAAVLVRRYALCLARDRWLLAVLLGQAPLIGAFLVLAYRAESPVADVQLLFKLGLAAVWFGCINACRELVKERRIYLRERFAGLGIAPVLASKLAVLLLLSGLQVLLLLGVARTFRFLRGDFADLALVLWATSAAALLLGLAVSAVVRNSDQALSLVPVVLIPQAILVGVAAPLDGAAGVLENGMISAWALRLLRDVADGAPWAGDAAPLGIMGVVLLGVAVAGLRALDRGVEARP